MTFVNELLQSLVDGLAMTMATTGKKSRQAISSERKKRKLKPLTAQNWQHIANALSDPSLPTTPQMRKVAQSLKANLLKWIDTQFTPKFIRDYIKEINLKGAILDELSEDDPDDLSAEEIEKILDKAVGLIMKEFENIKANWDWQMFANGLLADD